MVDGLLEIRNLKSKGKCQKNFRKTFYYESIHAKHVGKMGFRDERTHFFQWHSGNNVKIANPAEFEYQIPSLTWSSELCYVFRNIFGYPS